MATPHTTGVAALYLQAHPTASPTAVRDAIYAATTKGIVTSSKTANNHLLYSLFDSTPAQNQPPVANFTYSCTDLTCAFTDASTDGDGKVARLELGLRRQDDGDRARTPSHKYAAAGTYTVQLTVTDNDGATGTASKVITVSSGLPGGITLEATARRAKGATAYADLTWQGATGANVDVFRNGAKIKTTPNNDAYSDLIGKAVKGTYTYKVCEAGTTICSNEAAVKF